MSTPTGPRVRGRGVPATRGFTLIELIVVIVIIGILAGIATVSYLATRDTVTGKEPQRAIRAVETAQQLQYRSRGKYLEGATDAERLKRLDESFEYVGYLEPAFTGTRNGEEVLELSVGYSPTATSGTGITDNITDGQAPTTARALVIAAASRSGQCYGLVTFPEEISPTRYPSARITYPITGEGEVRDGETAGPCRADEVFSRYDGAISATGERAQW